MEGQGHFPNRPTRRAAHLRWHDGFVLKYNEIQHDDGGTAHQYTLFFPIDAADCLATTPLDGKDLCFRKPRHLSDPKASDREMNRARAALGEAEE